MSLAEVLNLTRTMPAIFFNSAPIALLVMLCLAIWRTIPNLTRIRDDSDATLRLSQSERIKLLEERLDRMQVTHREEVKQLRDAMEIMRADYEAKLSIMRHQLNNETASLDTLIALLKTNPDRVKENLEVIERMRAQQKLEISNERGRM